LPKAAAAKKAVAKKAIAKDEVVTGDDVTFEEVDSSEDWFVSIDEEYKDKANVLVYGKESAGKTTAVARVANIPGPGKMLVINAEAGLKVGALRKRGVDMDKLVIWPDPRKGERVTRLGLENVYRRMHADLMADPNSWKGVAWDSLSEIHQTVLTGAQAKRVTGLQRRGQDPDPDFVDRADYGTMSKMVRDLLRKFRDLPCHFFVTALERRTQDDDTKKIVYGPAVTPGLQNDVLGYVDVVMFLKAADEQGPYRALVKNSARYRVKDRFDVFPRVMAEPMGDRIIGYITGELTEATDPFQDDLSEAVKTSLDARPAPDEAEEEDENTDDNTDNVDA
jgi:hypothetical protein